MSGTESTDHLVIDLDPTPPDHMRDAGREASPETKRAKTDWTRWEMSPMRRLIKEGDGLALVSDQIARPPTLREEVLFAVARIQELHFAWEQYPIVLRDAIISFSAVF